jgi:hypothetical protein
MAALETRSGSEPVCGGVTRSVGTVGDGPPDRCRRRSIHQSGLGITEAFPLREQLIVGEAITPRGVFDAAALILVPCVQRSISKP